MTTRTGRQRVYEAGPADPPVVTDFEAGLALTLVEKEHVPITNPVPTMVAPMTAHPTFATRDPLPAEMVRRFAKALGDPDGWLHTRDLCAMDDCGYITVAGRTTDMIIGAFVIVKDGHDVTPDELGAFLRPRLSGYQIPSTWVFLSAYPQTLSGKIQRFALRDAWNGGEHTAAA